MATEGDASGATAVVALYDGRYERCLINNSAVSDDVFRKNVLHVANVGDSRCILSRGGRAVSLHRVHRLSESDERERIAAAGGKVLKNR